MHLRPAGETRIFHEGQGVLTHPLPPSHHPKWLGLFLHAHGSSERFEQPVEASKFGKRLVWVMAAASISLVALGGGYAAYYSSRIKPGVSVSNISLSGKTPAEAKVVLQKQADNFIVSLGSVGVQPAKAPQLGLSFDIDQTLISAAAAGSLNPLAHQQLSFKVKVDEQVLQKYLSSQNKVLQAAASAKIEIGTDGQVKVIPAQKGNSRGLEPTLAKANILAAARQGRPLTLIPAEFNSSPPITTDYADKLKADIEKIIATPVNLLIDGHAQQTTATQVASWITLTNHEDQGRIDAVVDSVKVTAYLDSIAKTYVKPPRAKVVTKNADGTTRVLSPGAPGTDITDKKVVAAELAASLNKQQPFTKALPVAYADPQTITAADYDKWIDVDLTNKRMYAYEHGNLVKEFLISAGAPATPTVKGQFTIKSKVRIQDMRGFNADGSRYYQPNVEYINYFYQDYAIHGNYWRPLSAFGHTNLSHGCVGVVNSDAKWIYDWAPVGTEVITHD